MAEVNSNAFFSQDLQDIDRSLGILPPLKRPRVSGVWTVYMGLGAVGSVIGTAYGAYNYSRENHLRQRLVDGLRSVGNQALSALGPIPRPDDIADFSGLEPADIQAQSPIVQIDTPSVNQVQAGQAR